MIRKRTALNRIREDGGPALWLFVVVFLAFSVTLALFVGFVSGFWLASVLSLINY